MESMHRRKARRVPTIFLMVLLSSSAASACGPISTERSGPTADEIAETSAQGQREVDTHAEDQWAVALEHRWLRVDQEWVSPRRISRLDGGLFGPSYFEYPTQFTFVYHSAHHTADLDVILSEFVTALEEAGATVVAIEPFASTPGGGPVVSAGVNAELSVQSLGYTLTITLSSVDFVDDGSTDFIRHIITVNESTE